MNYDLWSSQTGEKKPISTMHTAYIRNCIKMLNKEMETMESSYHRGYIKAFKLELWNRTEKKKKIDEILK